MRNSFRSVFDRPWRTFGPARTAYGLTFGTSPLWFVLNSCRRSAEPADPANFNVVRGFGHFSSIPGATQIQAIVPQRSVCRIRSLREPSQLGHVRFGGA